MMGLNGGPVGELGVGFDFGELLEAVRAAATPEEKVSANEAISVVTTRLRSNRTPVPGPAVRRAASKGRRAGARLGAAIVVTVFTASASLAISGQLPPGARDVASAFLAQMGLSPVPRIEASGQPAAAHTTEEPFGPADIGSDVWLKWMPPHQGDDGIHPPPVVEPTPVDPPPVVEPTPVDPPPVIEPTPVDPPPVVDPPGDEPPPVVDPPPGDDPPPVVEPPPVVDPPPVVEPTPVVDPPPADDPPPGDEEQGDDEQGDDEQGDDVQGDDEQGNDTPPGHDTPPGNGNGPPFGTPPGQDTLPGNGPPFDTPPGQDTPPGNGNGPPFDTPPGQDTLPA
jgi:hypothetical protein